MLIVDGKKIAGEIVEELKKQPKPKRALAAVLVGENKASRAFLKQKKKVAGELGVDFKIYELEDKISQEELEAQVERLNNDKNIGGIILQLPLPAREASFSDAGGPAKFDREAAIEKISPEKDVDNLTGEAMVEAPAVGVVRNVLKYVEWWPKVVLRPSFALKSYGGAKQTQELRILVVGYKGKLVGGPVYKWLNEIWGSRTSDSNVKGIDVEDKNLKKELAGADLVISGVGKKGLIDPIWLKEGAGVIDFGYPADLDNSKIKTKNLKFGFYTPTPGGTGPILVAELFRNFYKLGSRN